ncbi:MAG TPA: hypothetical protein VIN75_17925 [Burkholderiaceae bacterium]
MATGPQAGWSVDTEEVAPVGDAASSDKRSQRGMRETITIWLLVLLCVVVGLAFVVVLYDVDPAIADKRFEHLKNLLDVMLGPIVTLLSSVIGFYFGSQVAQDKAQSGESGKDK